MEFKKDFMLREIVGEAVLIPTGETAAHFNGLISVNELGRFILDEYEVERDVAKADLDEFLDILRKNEIVQDLIIRAGFCGAQDSALDI